MDPQRIKRVSKTLAKLLRHQAGREGMNIDSRGFLPLEDVLNHNYLKSIHTGPEEVFAAVNENDKKRFQVVLRHGGEETEVTEYVPGTQGYYICALQGHSIRTVTDSYAMEKLDKADYPAQILHGTFKRKLKLIRDSGGLSRMNRNHIHFAEGLPRYIDSSNDQIISGMRRECNAIIYLDIGKVKQSNLVFYRSGNGVILTEGNENGIVPSEYFAKVTDREGNLIAW